MVSCALHPGEALSLRRGDRSTGGNEHDIDESRDHARLLPIQLAEAGNRREELLVLRHHDSTVNVTSRGGRKHVIADRARTSWRIDVDSSARERGA
jgi:hypothetical protein